MKISDYLSPEERAHFREASDAVAVAQVLINYLLIAAAFGLAVLWPHPVTCALSALVLAGRIVGLGILNHDAAHNALFRTRGLNRSVARWLFAGPTLVDYDAYRKGHLAHHRHAGTLEDPDLAFVASYPVPASSMRRKITRDLIGRTGLRDGAFLVAMTIMKRRWRSLVVHLAMFGALYAASAPWAYGLWWVAQVFVVPIALRVRVIGEHGAVPDILSTDPRAHARTTHSNVFVRGLVAPNYVNFHCEHHFFANVPGHKLPALHRLLVERGFYAEHPEAIAKGYLDVVRGCIGDAPPRPELAALARRKASLANMV